MKLFRFLRLASVPAVALCVGIGLIGCAGMPGKRVQAGAAQPLQRLDLNGSATGDDALTLEMTAEFALADGDLDHASIDYARAAMVSADPAIASRAVRVAMAARQWRDVRRLLTRWSSLDPDDPRLWQARATVALHDGKTDDAYAELHRLVRQPGEKDWRAVAQVLLDALDKEQADEVLKRLAKPALLGDKSRTWIAASQLATHLGDLELARSIADETVDRFGGASAYTWAAQLRYRAGDAPGARKIFADGLHRYPKSLQLRRSYAVMLAQLGKYRDAASVLAVGPQDDHSYSARAAYAARSKDKTLLVDLYDELRSRKPPRSATQLNLLGQLAELLKHDNQALAWYRKVPDDDEHWFSAQLRIALLLDRSGKRQAAVDLIHQLQARTGDDDRQVGDAYLLEAELLDKRHEREAAVAVYDRGLKALPDDPRLLYARALLNDDLNHVAAAVRDLRRLVKLDPNNADALNALGYTLADRTRHQAEALALIEKALALKPGEPAIIDSLGWVQYRLGHLREAVKQLRTAYAKQPDPEIAAHLGEVLWKSGKKTEARKIWEQGRKKDASNKVLLETIKRLSS